MRRFSRFTSLFRHTPIPLLTPTSLLSLIVLMPMILFAITLFCMIAYSIAVLTFLLEVIEMAIYQRQRYDKM